MTSAAAPAGSSDTTTPSSGCPPGRINDQVPRPTTVFPDLRAIHLVRDGRDVVHSYMRTADRPLSWCAERWLDAVRAAQAFGARRPAQYLEIRYEDLVRTPGPILERVAAFLAVEFDERMLHHHELGLKLGDVEHYPELQGVWRPAHSEAVGRWRTAFDAAQRTELDRALGPTLKALGYETEADGAGG